MTPFTAETVIQNDHIKITMSGPIDEHADFTNIQAPGTNPIVVELSQVTRINSIGIRTWMMWFKKLAGRPLSLQACPKNVVDQFNLVSGFLPAKAIVESFFTPYYCEDCQLEQLVLFERGRHYFENKGSEKMQMPESPVCPKCGHTTELDIKPKVYFRFLNQF